MGLAIQERLKEVYNYDPESGLFTFKIKRGPMEVGSLAGTVNKGGYIQMSFDGKLYVAHRLAWLYMTGSWPDGWVDHRDTIRTNNRFDNLRVVTPTVSNRNRNMNKRNTSGTTGISWNKKQSKWQAHICVDSKMINLGSFEYKEDAIFARMTAEKKYGYWVDKVFDQL